jgi:hypothetical protein
MSSRVDYCACGNPEGENPECERCRLIAQIERITTAAQRVIRCHDVGTLSAVTGESMSIEALRKLVK